jgi:hypothetical protein
MSCSSSDDLDNVYSVLSDTDILSPKLTSISPVQERLSAYYTIGGVLLSLPSPIPKRHNYIMKWPESHRLIKRTRDNNERFNNCIQTREIMASKRDDLLLDLFPYWRTLDRRLKVNVRRNLQMLCDFPLRGKMIVEESDDVVQELEKRDIGVKQSLIDEIED